MPDLLLIAAGVLILFKTWQGWKLGLVRQLVSMGSAIVAGGLGTLAAPTAGAFLKQFAPYPAQVLMVVGGLLVGLVIFFVINIVGAILFKKTGDQTVTVVRLGFGITGAALGAVYGVFMVLAFAVGLRLLGSFAEAKLAMERTPQPGVVKAAPDPLAVKLAGVKTGLDDSAVGAVLRQVDPLPAATYTTLTKMATLTGNPKMMQRFMDFPGVRTVMDLPKVNALLSDPEITKAIRERKFASLLSNPHLVAAADDPEVSAKLKALEFENALDYALQGGTKP
jgi:hypothetical protein